MTTKTRAVMAAGIVVILAAGIVLQYWQNTELKRQLAAGRDAALLERQKLDLVQAKDESAQAGIKDLESEIARLHNRLADQERRDAVRALASATEATSHPAKEMPFATDVKCRVANGQTLVTGGFSQDPDEHTFLLITPKISGGMAMTGSGARAVTFKSYLVEAPDKFWDQMGWTELENDSSSGSALGELDPDQLSAVLATINNTNGVTIKSSPVITMSDGTRGMIDREMSGPKYSRFSLDLDSQITPDGQSVDLDIRSADVRVNPGAQSATITAPSAQ
ncbi:MAG TPA: hypothetical protein VL981_08315 [Candidatus Methylacidiphilales bacterium]|nr:hypothetical protein [Candidatus Methylacidiphilales bacterium]